MGECLNCRKCGKCNKKGKPSVMKNSKLCQERRKVITMDRIMGWALLENTKRSIVNIFKKLKGFR